MQDIMLKNIDTDNYYYDATTGERKLKPEYIIKSKTIKPEVKYNSKYSGIGNPKLDALGLKLTKPTFKR